MKRGGEDKNNNLNVREKRDEPHALLIIVYTFDDGNLQIEWHIIRNCCGIEDGMYTICFKSWLTSNEGDFSAWWMVDWLLIIINELYD